MAYQPVSQLYVCAGFNIQIIATRQNRDEEISLVLLASNAILILNSTDNQIDMHSISRLVSDTHCCFRGGSQTAVIISKLCTHVRRLTVGGGTLTIFLPKKCEGRAFLGKLAVYLAVVDECTRHKVAVTYAIKQFIKHLAGHIIVEWSRDVNLLSIFQHFADGVE